MTGPMVRTGLAVAALAGGLLLGGCGHAPADDRVGSRGSVTTRDVVTTQQPSGPATSPAAEAKSRRPRTAEATPSLPPGDPGVDAPSVPDPGTAGADPSAPGRARRTVPVEAMLSADSVRTALGGGWVRKAGGGDECVRPEGALGARAMSYGTSAGLVVETVGTYHDAGAADAAVKAIGAAAAGCGWSGVTDPRLGSASLAAEDGARSMVAVSSEGVLVLLVGSGDATRDPSRWSGLVDLAVGSSCPAAPDGCH